MNVVREAIQQLLRWGWKYNKNLEEQAAQLHMLTSWSQIVEVRLFMSSISCALRRVSLLQDICAYEVSDLESHIYTVTHTDGHTDTHGFTHTHIHTHSLTHIVYHFDLEIVIIQNNIISR